MDSVRKSLDQLRTEIQMSRKEEGVPFVKLFCYHQICGSEREFNISMICKLKCYILTGCLSSVTSSIKIKILLALQFFTEKVENVTKITKFVFPYICSFLFYLQ